MSGKRQHFVPQFLQRGFASHITKGEAFTWVYRKGARPFNANINNVGLEGSFYTENSDTLADDLITEAEGAFGELVEMLRSLPAGDVFHPHVAALIAHLEIRTRHFRQNFLQSAESLVSQLMDFLVDGDSFADLLERRLHKDPSVIETMLSEELAKGKLSPSMIGPLMKAVPLYMPVFRAQLRRDLPKLVAQLRSDLPRIVRNATKAGHIKALKADIAPEVRAKQYKDLRYTVVDLSDPSLILGDSPVLFQVDGPRPYKTVTEKKDKLKALFLPLGPRRVLIGSQSRSTAPPSNLHRTIACCSLEYFISHQQCEANDLLSLHIGEDAILLSKSEIAEIVRQSMNQ